MADEQYDLNLVQGEDFVRRFAYRNDDDTYLDWSTCSDLSSQIRSKESTVSPLLLDLAADDSPFLIVDPADAGGKYLRLYIPGAATLATEAKLYKTAAWDLFVTLEDGSRIRVLQGSVTMDPAATA